MIDYPQNIRESGLTIYDMINPSNTSRYIPIHILEDILSAFRCLLWVTLEKRVSFR